ncbi:energy transducer TonB [uncultured Parabacteroides sp.]|uniref:energy transducer TonB n=1 Tax=uncultured Parabacteroides sp. TaxID=512312 RepID=UPI00260A67E1|nr:energy transducer TonB [uncultured Parabacteroides sp.]
METKKARKSCWRISFGLFIFSFVTLLNLFAQKGDTEGDDKVYLRVDHMPYYLYGGSEENYAKDVEAIMKFISDNIRYPKDAWKIEKQGKVICRFVVEKDGRLSDIHIQERDSLYPSLDKEAIRVISSFPKWHPGTIDKKAVRTGFSLPVIFRMRGAKVQE